MKHEAARTQTRRAILEAMADVITETNGIGFSVQAVADRAGVSHRTVYNHFATRDALCDAFAEYVDEVLMATTDRAPDLGRGLSSWPDAVRDLYGVLARGDRHARASVMLMIGTRRPVKVWRARSAAIEKMIAREGGGKAPLPPKQVAAAVRLFMSSMGWHLLTDQCGLTTDEAAATSAWATRTLLEAATRRRTK